MQLFKFLHPHPSISIMENSRLGKFRSSALKVENRMHISNKEYILFSTKIFSWNRAEHKNTKKRGHSHLEISIFSFFDMSLKSFNIMTWPLQIMSTPNSRIYVYLSCPTFVIQPLVEPKAKSPISRILFQRRTIIRSTYQGLFGKGGARPGKMSVVKCQPPLPD